MIPDHSSFVFFLSAALVLLAIPGPAVLYVVGRSIGLGRSAGIVSALGIAVGTCVHVAAAAIGLSALLMSSAVAFGIVKYLGAAYLTYLGVQKIRREESLEFSASTARTRLSRVFGQGIIVKYSTRRRRCSSLLSFLNSSTRRAAQSLHKLSFSVLLFAAMGVVSDSLWGLFARTVADRLRGQPRWSQRQRYLSGGMLISLGLALSTARR